MTAPTTPPELVQLLTPEGERVEHPDYDIDLTAEEIRSLYRDLVLVRRVDLEAVALQRQGELGLWASLLGQEAAQVGSGRAMTDADMAFPTYREHGVAWCRGVDPLHLLGLFRGVNHGGWDPIEHNFHLYTIVIGSQTLHAVGYAMGIQRDGARGRLARLLRRRRHLPGRRERGLHLGVGVQRAGRVLLPEQPVGHLRAAGAADPDPALPAGQRLRLPRHPGRRQRRVRVPGGHPGGAAQRARGQRPDTGRGVHLPHGRPHHLRRPDALPGRRRAGGVEAQGPDRAGEGLPVPQPARRPGVLRQDRGRGRPARPGPAGPLPGAARPAARRDVRPRLRRAPRPHRRGARAVHDVHERLPRGAR